MFFWQKAAMAFIVFGLIFVPDIAASQEKNRVLRVCIGPCDPVKKKPEKPTQKQKLTPDGMVSEKKTAAMRAENERRRAAEKRDEAIVEVAAAKRRKEIDQCWKDKFGVTQSNWLQSNGNQSSARAFPEGVDCRKYITTEDPHDVRTRLAAKRTAENHRINKQIETQAAEYSKQLAIKERQESLRKLNSEQFRRSEQEAREIAAMKARDAMAKRNYALAQEKNARDKQAYEQKMQAYRAAQARYQQEMKTYKGE